MQNIKAKIQAQAELAKSLAQEAKRGIDARLLALRSQGLDQVKRKLSSSRDRWEADREYALSLALKVLDRAKLVRESLARDKVVTAKPLKKKAKATNKPKTRKKTAKRRRSN